MTRFYTRTGDNGTTGILGEGRVKKYDLRMEALGTLDELSAALGILRSLLTIPARQADVITIQIRLYELMAEVAASPENAKKFHKINQGTIADLEKMINEYSQGMTVPQGFIIPGETQVSAAADLARTIARRAERRIAELLDRGDVSNADLLVYLNRLSSLLFVMEIKLVQEAGKENPLAAQEEDE
jgi:cob(I)alamin adenosyltransferase